MPNPLLPATIPHRLGAALTGRSVLSYMRDVAPAVTSDGKTDLARLEAHLGRVIDPSAYLAAARRTDALRDRERLSKATSRSAAI